MCDLVGFASKKLNTGNKYQMYYITWYIKCLSALCFLSYAATHCTNEPNTMKIIFLLIVVQMCINKTMSQRGSVKHALLYEVFKCQIPFSYHDISYAIATEN